MNAPTSFDHADETIARDPTPAALRAHTILGVCEALGEDFGINPLWLRIPFAASVLISPLWSIVAYLALGLVVLASRLLFPDCKAASSEVKPVSNAANSDEELSLAA